MIHALFAVLSLAAYALGPRIGSAYVRRAVRR